MLMQTGQLCTRVEAGEATQSQPSPSFLEAGIVSGSTELLLSSLSLLLLRHMAQQYYHAHSLCGLADPRLRAGVSSEPPTTPAYGLEHVWCTVISIVEAVSLCTCICVNGTRKDNSPFGLTFIP